MMRVAHAFKLGRRELARLAHPHGVARIRYGERQVSRSVVEAMWGAALLFLASFAALAMVLAALGSDAAGAVSMALATLTNSGAGLALVAGPDAGYAALTGATKMALCVGMLVGRLELVAVVAVLTPLFWQR